MNDDGHIDLTAEAVLAAGVLVGFILGVVLAMLAMLVRGCMS